MRVVGLADSDSYVKWGASLLGQMSSDWTRQLVVVRTAKLPSENQLASALHGTGISRESVLILDLDEAIAYVASCYPHAVLIATIGPLADLLAEGVLSQVRHRPVLISGIPGIALPARRKALVYRSQIDVMVMHSHREVRRFQKLATANGFGHHFALAQLPFITARTTPVPANGDIVFAAQAIVPLPRAQRVQVLRWLAELAVRNPQQRVVLKVRAQAGERQTHDEPHSYVDLLHHELPQRPTNLVVEDGPMAAQLDAASALVTISSTAIIEAMARGIPVIALNEFGVRRKLLNEVFRYSGILAGADELLAGDFRAPRDEWARDNYLHDDSENTWLAMIDDLVRRAQVDALPVSVRVARGRGGALRRAWDRKRVLGTHDRSFMGFVALVVGFPARRVVVAWHRVTRPVRIRRRRARAIALERETPAIAVGGILVADSQRDPVHQ